MKTYLDHVYLKKSILVPVVDALLEEKIAMEVEEAKSLGPFTLIYLDVLRHRLY